RFWGRFYKAPMLRRVLDELVRHANETTRNGVPLARDSAIRRRLASLATEIEAVRLLFYRIGWMLQEGLPTPYETAPCKVMATELWKEISLLGWPGLLIPLEYGGSSGSLLDVSLLIEEMGRACFPRPYVQSAVVATSLLVTAANPAQRERQLPALARGDRICALALTEDSASFDRDGLALEGDAGGKLTGRKLFVKDAHVADDLIVVTRGAAGPNPFLLETQRAGVAVVPMATIAGDRPCEVSFAGVETRADDLLGAAGQGWDLLGPALQAGALARTAEMVGCAQHILELCVEHAKARKQFGRPLGSFQAV